MSAQRMWPTPNVPNGGRKPKGGTMTATGMTPEGKKRQVGLENAVTMQFAEAVSKQLTLFVEAFPASPTPWLADAAALRMTAISGLSSSDSFARLNPDGSWRKTCQGYSQVMLDGSLARFSETWPRAGMTRNGTAYRRVPLAPLTGEIGSGSWPTPCAEDAKNVPYQKGNHGVRYPMLLGAVAPERMWPTPTGRDHKDGSAQACANVPGNWLLGRVIHESSRQRPDSGVSGSLNPVFVEWLMGYPLGWTVCEAWATASSPRSRNGSRGASSPRR